MKVAREELVKEACAPLETPLVRNTLVAIHQKNEQVIDTVSSMISSVPTGIRRRP